MQMHSTHTHVIKQPTRTHSGMYTAYLLAIKKMRIIYGNGIDPKKYECMSFRKWVISFDFISALDAAYLENVNWTNEFMFSHTKTGRMQNAEPSKLVLKQIYSIFKWEELMIIKNNDKSMVKNTWMTKWLIDSSARQVFTIKYWALNYLTINQCLICWHY